MHVDARPTRQQRPRFIALDISTALRGHTKVLENVLTRSRFVWPARRCIRIRTFGRAAVVVLFDFFLFLFISTRAFVCTLKIIIVIIDAATARRP